MADSNQLYHVCSVAKDCGQWQTHSTVGHAHQVGMGQSRHHGRLSSVYGVGSDAGIRAVRGWSRTKESRSSHNVHRFVLKAFKEVQSDSYMELNVLRVSSLLLRMVCGYFAHQRTVVFEESAADQWKHSQRYCQGTNSVWCYGDW